MNLTHRSADMNQRIAHLRQFFKRWLEIDPGVQSRVEVWNRQLDAISHRRQEALIRIGVVGTVKAGKSTLINALLAEDLLRRGAGIITSMITRVRHANNPSAMLRFKPLDRVHKEIAHACWILNQGEPLPWLEGLDWKNRQHRQQVEQFLRKWDAEASQTSEEHASERHLIEAYLQGYDLVADHIQKKPELLLENDAVARHREFVDKDSTAVYLQDVVLKSSSMLHPQLEIADCQGSDSPNPLHFLKVQEYLGQTHLVFYTLSSRIGLRAADQQLLTTLKELKLLDHCLFIVNFDFNEHETLDDLQRVQTGVQQQLQRFVSNPKIVSLSALYELYQCQSDAFSEKQQAQFRLWSEYQDFLRHHQSNWEAMRSHLQDWLEQGPLQVVETSEAHHLKRLVNSVNLHLLSLQQCNQELDSSQQAVLLRMKNQLRRIDSTSSGLQSMISGILAEMKNRVSLDLDNLFGHQQHGVARRLKDFVGQYQFQQIDWNEEAAGKKNSLSHVQLSTLYQEIQNQVLKYVAEELNTMILQQIKDLQNRYLDTMQQAFSPFESVVHETLAIAEEAKTALGLQVDSSTWQAPVFQFPNLPMISFTTTLHYDWSSRLQGALFVGFNFLKQRWKTWFAGKIKEEGQQAHSPEMFVEESMVHLKAKVTEALEFDLGNYRENIKFMYLLKGLKYLADSAQTQLLQGLAEMREEVNHFGNLVAAKQQLSTEQLEKLNTLQAEFKDLFRES